MTHPSKRELKRALEDIEDSTDGDEHAVVFLDRETGEWYLSCRRMASRLIPRLRPSTWSARRLSRRVGARTQDPGCRRLATGERRDDLRYGSLLFLRRGSRRRLSDTVPMIFFRRINVGLSPDLVRVLTNTRPLTTSVLVNTRWGSSGLNARGQDTVAGRTVRLAVGGVDSQPDCFGGG